MDLLIWLILACIIGFFGYVLYTRQGKWLLSVVRNMVLGTIGILVLNFLLIDAGVTIGINLITTMIVGLLGVPGFFLLFATQILL